VPTVKAIIEYDGTEFHGFQKQPSLRTIQGELEHALKELFRQPVVKVIGAGRTDAGVHAVGQVVSFEAPDRFPADRICPALNGLLPPSIRVKSSVEAPAGFHARYSAKARTYVYTILNRESPSALLTRYAWQVTKPLDMAAMRTAAAELIGKRDFASFGAPERAGGSTVRRIFNLEIERKKEAIFFKMRADAFLRGMVRAIVGTLVEIGQGKRPPEDIIGILNACDRRETVASAPPQGLCLTRVEY
jgi:tRNA pseudouridine38-40 synthase